MWRGSPRMLWEITASNLVTHRWNSVICLKIDMKLLIGNHYYNFYEQNGNALLFNFLHLSEDFVGEGGLRTFSSVGNWIEKMQSTAPLSYMWTLLPWGQPDTYLSAKHTEHINKCDSPSPCKEGRRRRQKLHTCHDGMIKVTGRSEQTSRAKEGVYPWAGTGQGGRNGTGVENRQ